MSGSGIGRPTAKMLDTGVFSGLYISGGRRIFVWMAAAKAPPPPQPTLNYGIFINNVITFLIVAFSVFLIVQLLNRWTKKPEAPTTKDCPQCAMTIPLAAKRCGHCTTQLA